PLQQLLDCRLHGVHVIDLLMLFEREQGRLPLDFLKPDWLIYSEGSERGLMSHVFKRAFDILASLTILCLSWPLMLAAVLAIKLEDGFWSPVVYRQTRVGYLARNFQVLKFRSMVVDAEEAHGAQWAVENDQRITRVGNFLRKSRIDELPQLFNVLRGDMSFVGPRPERPHFVNQLSDAVPFYQERHAVKPGITGWAQVRFPYAATFKDAAQKHEYDLFYIKNHSIFLDLIILCQTAEVVMFGKGAR
ncbi:MAG: TIGR03013 family XrtA/PEP-CTERM system glycosyltransferase, partial [Granulosicoccus sp.]